MFEYFGRWSTPPLECEEALLTNEPGSTDSCEKCATTNRATRLRIKRPVNAYIAVVVTFILGLQLFRTIPPDECPVETRGDNVSDTRLILKSFSPDLRYQSLDHQFDELWQYEDAIISIPDPYFVGSQTEATISM